MKLKEYMRSNPGFLQRAMRCDNTEELYRLVRLEGIEASPRDIDYAVSLINLGDHELEAVAGGKTIDDCMGGIQPRGNIDGNNYKINPPSPGASGQSLNRTSYLPTPTLPTTPVEQQLVPTFNKPSISKTQWELPPVFPTGI